MSVINKVPQEVLRTGLPGFGENVGKPSGTAVPLKPEKRLTEADSSRRRNLDVENQKETYSLIR
jgi:hypothetical protein